jgi:hypothetical protein
MLQHQNCKAPERYRYPKEVSHQIRLEELLATFAADQRTSGARRKPDHSNDQRAPAETFHVHPSSFKMLNHFAH